MAKRHIQHVKSSVVEQLDGKAKAPTADDLLDGEIAVNFGAGSETLFIKNSNREIVAFGKEVSIGEEAPLSGTNYQLFIDETNQGTSEVVYTQSQVDNLIANLQSQIDELKSRIN